MKWPSLACLTGFLALGAAAYLPLACHGPPGDSPANQLNEIRLGVIAPLSGPLGENIGRHVREGTELAVNQVEERGGIEWRGQRHKIVLLWEDSLDRPEMAVRVARKLINQDEVAVLIGPALSRNALAVAMVAENQGTPMISPTATHVDLTHGRKYVFRASLVDDQQGQALARFAFRDLAARRAAILYDIASAHNRGLAEIFKRDFEQAGGQVVAVETYTTGERDFHLSLTRIRDAAVDVLLLPNYVDEVPLQVSLAREMGIDAVFLGSDAWDDEIFPGLPAFEGSYYTDDWQVDIPELETDEARTFVDAYHRAHGLDRRPTAVTALAFDAASLVLTAIEACQCLGGDNLRQSLTALEDYRGVTGELSLGGDSVKGVVIFKINGGRVLFEQRIRAEPSSPARTEGEYKIRPPQ